MNSERKPKEISAPHFLTRKRALNILKAYGFIEIADAIKFLQLICGNELDTSEIAYLRKKIEFCLKNHDNQSDYFIPLREFATELDCLSDINLSSNV